MRGILHKICLLFLCTILVWGQIFTVYGKKQSKYLKSEEVGTDSAVKLEDTSLYAKAAVLMDARSGRILYGKNQDVILPMASTTKIMTCIVALENIEMDQMVQISKKAASMPDVQLNAKEGDYFYIKDLLYSLMLESHNDSAVAIAEAVGGSVEQFADLMNKKAKEIGCQHTYFITPNGLDAKNETGIHSTTAAELAKIMSYCVKQSSQKDLFLAITASPSYTFHNFIQNEDGSIVKGSKTYSCNNHNAFLQMMEGVKSGKTGFTGNAGYCYVGYLERGETHLVAVVLACGWPPQKTKKWSDVRKLMEYGIANYTYKPFPVIQVSELEKIPVANSQKGLFEEEEVLELEIVDACQKSSMEEGNGILMKATEELEIEIRLPKEVNAPVKKDTCIGEIVYSLDGNIYKKEKVLVNRNVYRIDYKYCLENAVCRFLLSISNKKR